MADGGEAANIALGLQVDLQPVGGQQWRDPLRPLDQQHPPGSPQLLDGQISGLLGSAEAVDIQMVNRVAPGVLLDQRKGRAVDDLLHAQFAGVEGDRARGGAQRAVLPLAVARVALRLLGEDGAGVGVQLNTPVVASIAAPAGAPESSEKLSTLAGRSASVALAVSCSSEPSFTL